MANDELKELDEAAFPSSAQSDVSDERVLELMELVATRSNGLELLVERYAKSKVPVVLRSVAFLLAQAATSVTEKTCNLVYDFIETMGAKSDASTLMNVLTAVQRQAINDVPWEPRSPAPPMLHSFLLYCLDQNELVQSTALRLMARLYEDGLLSAAFSEQELAVLRQKAAGLGKSELIVASMEGLASFITQQ